MMVPWHKSCSPDLNDVILLSPTGQPVIPTGQHIGAARQCGRLHVLMVTGTCRANHFTSVALIHSNQGQ